MICFHGRIFKLSYTETALTKRTIETKISFLIVSAMLFFYVKMIIWPEGKQLCKIFQRVYSNPLTAIGRLIGPAHSADVARLRRQRNRVRQMSHSLRWFENITINSESRRLSCRVDGGDARWKLYRLSAVSGGAEHQEGGGIAQAWIVDPKAYPAYQCPNNGVRACREEAAVLLKFWIFVDW